MSKQGKNIYLRKDGRWEGRYPKGYKFETKRWRIEHKIEHHK